MRFAKGNLAIFGGVNQLRGSYALVNDTVTMSELISTRKAGPPELMELEQEFARTLSLVDGFHAHEDKLELLRGTVSVATFRAAE